MGGFIVFLPIIIFISFILAKIIKVLNEYERGVIFTLGRVSHKSAGPGLIILIPFLQVMRKVDLRLKVHDIPSQDIISSDNVSVKVNAVLYFRVIDGVKALIQVENFAQATSQLAQTTLRSVLGKYELDDMLQERTKLNKSLREILDDQTEAWGIKVSNVEIKHVDVDQSMIRAIAKQAEAERERRSKIIIAEGEQQAATKLAEAAEILSNQNGALQLRYLNTLQEIANDRSNTIVFPVELTELVSKVLKK